MMTKPRLFIGSSSEGLKIAEEMFTCMSRETEPTLWEHRIFTPGAYPLEALDEVIRRNQFAVLVASADDQLVKRGVSAAAMRDNILLEFGLFLGAFGRRRVFLVCPDSPKLELPSDLYGMVTTTYDAERSKTSASDRAASVQTACQQIRDIIREQWDFLQKHERDREAKVRASKESQSIQRLYTVSARLRDALMALQANSFAALFDRPTFEDVKKRTVEEVNRIAQEFDEDALTIGCDQELEQLRSATHDALVKLPFPEELSMGRAAIKEKAIGAGLSALGILISGGDPISEVQKVAEDEAERRLSSLGRRYSEWWDQYSPLLQNATTRMQDKLFNAVLKVSSALQKS